MNTSARALPHAQQGEILFPFAQQYVLVREPVAQLDAAVELLHALLVQIDAALLDRPSGFALRLNEPDLYDRVDEGEGVFARHGRGGDLASEGVEYPAVGGMRVEIAEQHVRGDAGG